MKTLKGFTLIELVVVITVIVMLVTILLPALTTAAGREKSFRAICANRLKNLGMANTIYANEYDNVYCPASFFFFFVNGEICKSDRCFDGIRWPANRYFRNILNIDSYANKKITAGASGSAIYEAEHSPYSWPPEFLCPADEVSIYDRNIYGGVSLSYAYNITEWMIRGVNNFGELFNLYLRMGHSADNMPAPSTKLVFIDGIDFWTQWSSEGADYKNWDRRGQVSIADYRSWHGASYGPVLYRHSEGANMTFYDGHVQYMKKQRVFVYGDYYSSGSSPLPVEQRRPGMWVANMEDYIRRQNGQP